MAGSCGNSTLVYGEFSLMEVTIHMPNNNACFLSKPTNAPHVLFFDKSHRYILLEFYYFPIVSNAGHFYISIGSLQVFLPFYI